MTNYAGEQARKRNNRDLLLATAFAALLYNTFHYFLANQALNDGLSPQRIEDTFNHGPFTDYVAWYLAGKPGRELRYLAE